MTAATFAPVLYFKEHCPFCMKIRLFLLEAGLLNDFEVQEYTPGTDQERTIKAELAPHFEKTTFPTVQIEPGKYMNEADDIIAYYAARAKVDPARMPVLNAYIKGPFAQLFELYMENMALKKKLA